MNVRNCGELGLDLQKIVKRLLANQNLLKLLYYTDKDPLANKDLDETQKKDEIYQKLLKIVPIIGPLETAQSMVSMSVVRGNIIDNNTEFLSLYITFEVFVPLTQWIIKDENLRPFAIIGEIQNSLSGKTINGLGKIEFDGFNKNFATEEMTSYKVDFFITEYA
jgi:hypothetical protein